MPKEEKFSFKSLFVPLTTKKALTFVILIGIIVFFNSLFNGFVWDDEGQITNNSVVQSLSNIPHFYTGGTYVSSSGNLIGSYYRPIMLTFFSFFYNLFGANPFPYHLFQVALHIINALLVYLLLRELIKRPLAFFFSLLFLIHPMNQAAVGFISHLQDVLFFLFGITALFLTKKYKDNTKGMLFVSLFLLLSFLSKETGIVFVPIIILYCLFFAKRSWIFFVSILFTTALFIFLRFQALHSISATGNGGLLVPIASESFPMRLLSIPEIFFYYLKTFFYPARLAIDQLWVIKNINFPDFYLPLILDMLFLLVLILLGYCIYKFSKKNIYAYIFFTSWFLSGIVIHLQIIPLDQTVGDHWFYFPMVGLLGIFGVFLNIVKISNEFIKKTVITVAIVIIVGLSVRTIVRSSNWIDNLTLYAHDLSINPDSARLERNLGVELLRIKQYDQAKIHFEHVTKLEPLWGDNWYSLGISYEYSGNPQKAKEYYLKSIQIAQLPEGYENLGGAYLFYNNDSQSAGKIFQEGIKRYPNNQRLHLLFAVAQYNLHNNQLALSEAEKAYALSPTNEAKYVLYQITNNLQIKLQ
jgi:tetratricopeptide (TPR) repeat protein